MTHISIRVNGDGTTSIDDAVLTTDKEAVVYDLSGRRVSVPQKGGVYIMNGKKVVIK